jgi:hypothetical protein
MFASLHLESVIVKTGGNSCGELAVKRKSCIESIPAYYLTVKQKYKEENIASVRTSFHTLQTQLIQTSHNITNTQCLLNSMVKN